MSNTHGFTEAELNKASVAGISNEALEVAKEYPTCGFGAELRKHFGWGAIDKMAQHVQSEGGDAEPEQFWLGGSFTTLLAFVSPEKAYGGADRQNSRILYDLFSDRLEKADVHVPDRVKIDVEEGNILIYEYSEVVA